MLPRRREGKIRHPPLDGTTVALKGCAQTAARGMQAASTEKTVSDRIERPWALMRHHAGWADVFHIDSETSDSITGFYPDRESVGPPVTYSMRAVLARYPTIEAARAAREGAVAEWRKHDAGCARPKAPACGREAARGCVAGVAQDAADRH
jgi:hypothetical protein